MDITNQIKKDPELRRVYKDNIAMAFKDECSRYKKKTGKQTLSRDDIHKIANTAADNYIDQWLAVSKGK
jgi:hypothetical protein